MNIDERDDNKISELAKKVFELARDAIVVKYRFFDKSLAAVKLEEDAALTGYVSDAGYLSYNPVKLLKDYRDEMRENNEMNDPEG